MASLANNKTILKLAHALQRTFRFIKPSFLSKLEPEPIHRPTDFLDGLRGFAALFVFNYHCIAPLYPDYGVGFWSKGGLENDYWITQFPIIRSFYAGPICVLLFFVLSGFSITLKPLKLARQGKHEELLHSLVSATFRRACRLYLPCLGLLAMVLIGIYLGFFDHSLERSMSYPFLGKRFPQPTIMESGQFKDFLVHIWYWSDPLNAVPRPRYMPYSGQLWTIPVELKCSLIAWIVVLGLARTRSTLRISTTFAISVWMFARDHIYPALFVAGPGLAELYLISVSTTETTAKPMSNQDVIPFSHLDHSQALPKPPKETQAQKVKNTFIFLFALHLCSFPAIDGATSLGWPLLAKLAIYLVGTKEDGSISTDTFGYFGSVLLVYSVSQSPWLQRAFSTPLARYLGKISFSLYCVHQPLLNAFGFVNFKFWWELPFLHRNLLFLIAFLIQLAVTVLASDMFYRAVDAPSVVFAKWVESKCTEKK